MTTIQIGGNIRIGGGISISTVAPSVTVYDIITENDLQLITENDNNITTE